MSFFNDDNNRDIISYMSSENIMNKDIFRVFFFTSKLVCKSSSKRIRLEKAKIILFRFCKYVWNTGSKIKSYNCCFPRLYRRAYKMHWHSGVLDKILDTLVHSPILHNRCEYKPLLEKIQIIKDSKKYTNRDVIQVLYLANSIGIGNAGY